MKQIKNSMLYLIPILLIILIPFKAKAESICLQAQWLAADYEPNTPVGTVSYTYGRWLNACGNYAKVQIPIKVQAITTNPNYAMGLNSTIWRIELTNGETYYGKLENGYIEFILRTKGPNGTDTLAVKSLMWDGYQPGEYKILVSKYIQAYKLDDNSEIVEAIEEQSTELHQQWLQDATNWNDFKNSDISNNTKQQPNQDEYDNVQTQEDVVYDSLDDIDVNTLVDMNIDINTSNWIWNTITSILQANARVMAMVISVLSLGLCKFVLGR